MNKLTMVYLPIFLFFFLSSFIYNVTNLETSATVICFLFVALSFWLITLYAEHTNNKKENKNG